MRKILLFLLTLFPVSAQVMQQALVNFPVGTLSVSQGWSYLQGTSGVEGAGDWEVQTNACGSSFSTACTLHLVASTTAGSSMAFGVVTGNSITITSAYSCTSSSGCNSGNAIDTFTLLAASAGHVTNSANPDSVDVVYVPSSVGGATYVTLNLSVPTGFEYAEFMELLAPLCNGSRCAASFDKSVTNKAAAGSCNSSCTGTAMTLTATDAIIGIIDSGGGTTLSGLASPYHNDFIGNPFALDATSDPGWKVTTTGWYTLSQIAFKTTGLSYTPSGIFTPVNMSAAGNGGTIPFGCINNFSGSSCAFTPASSTSGDLIFIGVNVGSGSATISSVSGRGTYVIPSGANTCQNTSVLAMSCAYTLSSTGGSGAITVTMSGTCTDCAVVYYESSRTSGSFVLDAQNSSSSVGTTTISGQTLSITGPDVCFTQTIWTNTTPVHVATSLYPFPGGADFFQAYQSNGPMGTTGAVFNTYSGAAPKFLMSTAATTSASFGVCFK